MHLQHTQSKVATFKKYSQCSFSSSLFPPLSLSLFSSDCIFISSARLFLYICRPFLLARCVPFSVCLYLFCTFFCLPRSVSFSVCLCMSPMSLYVSACLLPPLSISLYLSHLGFSILSFFASITLSSSLSLFLYLSP